MGIGPNKLVAKIASDLEKPDGLVVVGESEVSSFLSPLPIRRLWGIGPKTEESLIKKFRTETVGKLALIPIERLEWVYGLMGRCLHQRANGIDDDSVCQRREAKSIVCETTFERDTSDRRLIHKTLVYLCDRVASRLRAADAPGRTVALKLRYASFETHSFSQTLTAPNDIYQQILEIAEDLFRNTYREGRKLRLLGVSVSNFSDYSEPGLFEPEEESREKEGKVGLAVGKARRRFGKHSVRWAEEI